MTTTDKIDKRAHRLDEHGRAVANNSLLADQLGVSQPTVSRIRSGERYPSYAVMKKIEKLLDWSWTEQQEIRHDDDPDAYRAEFDRRLESWIVSRSQD